MKTKTHFKKLFNSDYLGAWDIETDTVLTIKRIEKQQVNLPDGKKDDALVCSFVEGGKPMILNKTNCKVIAKIYRSRFIEDWIGKPIQIYATEVKAFGELVDALRVRPSAPKVGKEAEKKHLKQQIVNALANLPDMVAEEWKTRLKTAKAEGTDTIKNLQTALKAIQDAI